MARGAVCVTPFTRDFAAAWCAVPGARTYAAIFVREPALTRTELPAAPYDLRHSFSSLLLAEGHTVHYVAAQLGHGAEQTLRTYGDVIGTYAGPPSIDAEAEIRKAKSGASGPRVAQTGEVAEA